MLSSETGVGRTGTDTAGRRRPDPTCRSTSPPQPAGEGAVSRLWSDPLGRAANRGAQLLLVAAVVGASVWLLTRVSIVTTPLLLALIFAAAFAPWMERTRRHGLPPALGAGLALIFVLGSIIGALVFIVGSVGHEWDGLARATRDAVPRLTAWLQSLPVPLDERRVTDMADQLSAFLTSADFRTGALGGLGVLTEVGATLGLMAIVLFFLLMDGPRMWEFLARPLEGSAYERAERIRRKTVDVFGGYISSTAAAAVFDAAGILIGLLILQVPLAVPLAILTLLLAFIPIVGAVSAGAVAALVALVSNGPLSAALVVLVVIVVNQLEGNVLKPIVMGRTVSLHALVVLIAITAGTAVGGIVGALLAVPLTAAAWGVVQVWDGEGVAPRWARPKDRRRGAAVSSGTGS